MEIYDNLSNIFSLLLAPKSNEDIKTCETILFQVSF